MTRQLGTVIVLSGPSGVGKSTLVGRLREAMPELEFSISCTTRPPRRGEIDHVHYHFLDDAAFEQHLAAGDFLEHAGVFSRRYGTLKSEIYAFDVINIIVIQINISIINIIETH